MKGIVKKCCDCARTPGRDPMRPIVEFYKGKVKYSQYCKTHMRERLRAFYAKKKTTLFQFKYGLYASPPHHPLQWPLIQACGEKAQCRDCKGIWSLKLFNRSGNKRKDGTFKKLPLCAYCQSKMRAKRKLIAEHRAREQAREIA